MKPSGIITAMVTPFDKERGWDISIPAKDKSNNYTKLLMKVPYNCLVFLFVF